jgi:hypothetical protein
MGRRAAIEIGKGLKSQGERTVGGVARQVEQNPLASAAVAFALGGLCATLGGVGLWLGARSGRTPPAIR